MGDSLVYNSAITGASEPILERTFGLREEVAQ